MEYAALAIALIALIHARLRSASLRNRITDLEAEVRRRANSASEESDAKLAILRKLLVRIVEGKRVTRDMIEEERLWQDVLPDAGREISQQDDVLVLDVRTPQEHASGVIPGALRIPLGELEERHGEIPKDARKKLVVCEAGGRSAAACEFLSSEGFDELYNLAGGMSSYTGERLTPKR